MSSKKFATDIDLQGNKLLNVDYNRPNEDGMGYILLKKDIPFADQLTQENTIYEIRYDFDLGNEEITIPANSILDFQGGSLNNGIITFSNTLIRGVNPIIRTDVLGSLLGMVYLSWFGVRSNDSSFDNSVVINKIASISKNLILENGVYFYQNQITLSNLSQIHFYGDLVYNGLADNISTIKLTVNSANVYFHSIIGNQDTTAENNNIIGLNIINSNSSYIQVDYITQFNTNIRLSGIGYGCCYNTLNVLFSITANIHFHLFQENGVNNQIGWCNQNHLTGGRIAKYSNDKRDSIVLLAKGGENDSYNSINGITFDYFSIEGFPSVPPIQLTNIMYSKFLYLRNEGNFSPFIFFNSEKGNFCFSNEINLSYNQSSSIVYESNGNYLPVKKSFSYNVFSGTIRDFCNKYTNQSNVLYDLRKKVFNIDMGLFYAVGIIVEYVSRAIINLYFKNSDKIIVRFFDENFNEVKHSIIGSFYYTSSYYTNIPLWVSGNNEDTQSLMLPTEKNNVKYVFLGAKLTSLDSQMDITSSTPLNMLSEVEIRRGQNVSSINDTIDGTLYYDTLTHQFYYKKQNRVVPLENGTENTKYASNDENKSVIEDYLVNNNIPFIENQGAKIYNIQDALASIISKLTD